GTYVRNPFNGGGNGVSNPFETFRYLRLNELTFRQIGNLNASWSALSAAQHQVSVTATGGFDRVQISGDLFSPPFLEYEGSDRSSANGDRHKYYVFPRASASYRFPDLGELVNEVKLRGGWGRTGNRPRYGDRDVLLAVGTTIGGTATPVQAGTLGDSLIKPETLTEIEAGAEVIFLERKLQFQGDWVNRPNKGQLLQPP